MSKTDGGPLIAWEFYVQLTPSSPPVRRVIMATQCSDAEHELRRTEGRVHGYTVSRYVEPEDDSLMRYSPPLTSEESVIVRHP